MDEVITLVIDYSSVNEPQVQFSTSSAYLQVTYASSLRYESNYAALLQMSFQLLIQL